MASTALLIGSAIAGGSSLLGGILGGNAATSAANKEVAAAQQAQANIQAAGATANTELGSVLGQQENALAPYAQAGTAGLSALNTAAAPGGSLSQQFSFDPTQVANNPDYQFNLAQGTQAVQRAAAASGTLNSGGTLKALDQYSQGLASTYENQYYNQALSTYGTNRNATLGNIQTQLNTGTYGTSGITSALQNYGNQFSANTLGVANQANNYLTSGASASAAGILGQANAYSGALGTLSNIASSTGAGISASQNYQALLQAIGSYGQSTGAPAGSPGIGGLGGTPVLYQNGAPYAAPATAQAAPTAFSTPGIGSPYAGGYLQSVYGAPV